MLVGGGGKGPTGLWRPCDHRRRHSREEVQSPSGPLFLQGLWGEDRSPAGLWLVFQNLSLQGCMSLKRAQTGHTVLGGKSSVNTVSGATNMGRVCALPCS